ncbi:ribbon-helix-helix protein, CopG family [uncultured Gordonia sp.]|uniref:ribbon-helix-helix protein, CopG family n=1 Tax=uncultured Gordonia sp. TaxID=198437 RepID=UPI0026083991|nr:ribbon-helix-helix protein, CopG family [uncultured Gordonia sp.]
MSEAKRTARLQLRLSAAEVDQQERLAAQLGVSRAVAIRRAVAAMLGEAAPGESVAATSALPRLRCEIAASGEKALRFQVERLVSNLRQFEAGHGVNVSAIRAKTGMVHVDQQTGPLERAQVDLTELLDGDLGRTLAKVADDAARGALAARVRDEIGRPVAELLMRVNSGAQEPPTASELWTMTHTKWLDLEMTLAGFPCRRGRGATSADAST